MSSAYECQTCGKVFDRKSSYDSHKKRITPCVLDPNNLPEKMKNSKHRCVCGRGYADSGGLRRHKKDCSIAASAAIIPEEKKGTELEELRRQLAESKAVIAALSAKADKGDVKSGSSAESSAMSIGDSKLDMAISSSHSDINAKVEKNTYTINVFGGEYTGHINPTIIRDLLKNIRAPSDEQDRKSPAALSAAEAAVLGVAKLIYTNPEWSENFTCFIPSRKKMAFAMVHRADGWKLEPCSEITGQIVEKAIELMFVNQPWAGMKGVDESETKIVEDCGNVLSCVGTLEASLKKASATDIKEVLACQKGNVERKLGKLPKEGEKYPPPDPSKRKPVMVPVSFGIGDIRAAMRRFPMPDEMDEIYANFILQYCADIKCDVDRAQSLTHVFKKFTELKAEAGLFFKANAAKFNQMYVMLQSIMADPSRDWGYEFVCQDIYPGTSEESESFVIGDTKSNIKMLTAAASGDIPTLTQFKNVGMHACSIALQRAVDAQQWEAARLCREWWKRSAST